MSRLVDGVRLLAAAAVAIAAVGALAGFLIAHFAHAGRVPQGVGWGMCIAGALVALVVGQSGSPSRMAAEGRWGAFGQFWGGNRALPESPLWSLAGALVAMLGGIAIIVLTY